MSLFQVYKKMYNRRKSSVGGIFCGTVHSGLIRGINCGSNSKNTMVKCIRTEKCANSVSLSRCTVIVQCKPLFL